jgi:hypothetical protein
MTVKAIKLEKASEIEFRIKEVKMNLTDLFEAADNKSTEHIAIKDPRAKQALKAASSKYGWADNDLEVFVAMMQDQQSQQDKNIETQFDVNAGQEKDIGFNFEKTKKNRQSVSHNEQHVNDLEKRVSKLEQGQPTETDTDTASVSEGPDIGKQFKQITQRWNSPNAVTEAATPNFTADDLQVLNNIRDLETLKQRAIGLIANPNSSRPMKPEKIAWFERAIEQKRNNGAIIKLMWDLFLSGEGAGVIGSKSSTNKNSYRTRFSESKKVRKVRRLTESFIKLLEASNDIEWEPQPEFRGRGGIATSTGDSAKRQRLSGPTPSSTRRYSKELDIDDKLNGIWQKYLRQLKALSPAERKNLVPMIKKIAITAKNQNVQLNPNPAKFKFLD